MQAELDTTTRHYARGVDEAFRTPTWRSGFDGPYHGTRHLRAPVRWIVVVLIALALVGVQLP